MRIFICLSVFTQLHIVNLSVDEAFSRESKSLRQVCQLVIKACESLALWKLLSENQLQVTIANLKQVTVLFEQLLEYSYTQYKTDYH